jgi:uncharacterized membrane protein
MTSSNPLPVCFLMCLDKSFEEPEEKPQLSTLHGQRLFVFTTKKFIYLNYVKYNQFILTFFLGSVLSGRIFFIIRVLHYRLKIWEECRNYLICGAEIIINIIISGE